MLDANMRHLPKDWCFFVYFAACKEGCEPYKLGVRQGDYIQCQMLDETSENPHISIYVEGSAYTIKESDKLDYWCTYQGNIDGTGFISEHVRQLCSKKILNKV